MNLKIIFIFEGNARTKRSVQVSTAEEAGRMLDKALEWEQDKEGRKASAYCPGQFATTRVYGLIEHWLPKRHDLEDRLAHMGD